MSFWVGVLARHYVRRNFWVGGDRIKKKGVPNIIPFFLSNWSIFGTHPENQKNPPSTCVESGPLFFSYPKTKFAPLFYLLKVKNKQQTPKVEVVGHYGKPSVQHGSVWFLGRGTGSTLRAVDGRVFLIFLGETRKWSNLANFFDPHLF